MLVTVGHTAVSASVTVIVASSGARFSSAPIALSRASRLARKVGMSSRSRGQKNRPGLPAVFPNIEPHLLLLLGGHCRPFATIEAFAGTVDEDEDHVAVTNREGALVMVGGIEVGTLSKAAAEMIVGPDPTLLIWGLLSPWNFTSWRNHLGDLGDGGFWDHSANGIQDFGGCSSDRSRSYVSCWNNNNRRGCQSGGHESSYVRGGRDLGDISLFG